MWIHTVTAAIGGLENVAFTEDTDLVVVLSSQGIGVFNCITGEKFFRIALDWWAHFDESNESLLSVPGFSEMSLKVSGLHSGFKLDTSLPDGSRIELLEAIQPGTKGSIQKVRIYDR